MFIRQPWLRSYVFVTLGVERSRWARVLRVLHPGVDLVLLWHRGPRRRQVSTPVEIIKHITLLLYVFIHPYIVMGVHPCVAQARPSIHAVLPAMSTAQSCCLPLQQLQVIATCGVVLGVIWGHPTVSVPLWGVWEAGWGACGGEKVLGLCAAMYVGGTYSLAWGILNL